MDLPVQIWTIFSEWYEDVRFKEQTAPQHDLRGKVILITGGSAGLGAESAKQLAAMKPEKIILTARNVAKAEAVAEALRQTTVHIQVEELDLCSLGSVQRLSKRLLDTESRLDVLMCNAGVGHNVGRKLKTDDGFDDMFQANNLGHFLLVRNLHPLLAKTGTKAAPARIITLSSLAHRFAWGFKVDHCNNPKGQPGNAFYGPTKVMSIWMAKGFAKDYAKDNITANSLHPGTVNTEFAEKFGATLMSKAFPVIYAFFDRGLHAGAATQVYLASAPEAAHFTGQYFSSMRAVAATALAEDQRQYEVFMNVCDEYVKDYRL
ncbi:Dehydrogenase reductase SDR member 13 [Savitreella phatthalungensis]